MTLKGPPVFPTWLGMFLTLMWESAHPNGILLAMLDGFFCRMLLGERPKFHSDGHVPTLICFHQCYAATWRFKILVVELDFTFKLDMQYPMLYLTLFSQGIIILAIICPDYSFFDYWYMCFLLFRNPGESREVENSDFNILKNLKILFSTFFWLFFFARVCPSFSKNTQK